MDRRQRKTRKLILEACNELLKSTDFHKLTIKQITERADINRGTFYLHFEDKFDMLESYENELIEKIFSIILEHFSEQFTKELFVKTRYETIVNVFTVFAENKSLLQFVLKAGHQSFQQKLHKMLKSIIEEKVLPHIDIEGAFPLDLLIAMFTSNFLTYAEYVYQTEESVDIEEAANFLFELILYGPVKKFGLK